MGINSPDDDDPGSRRGNMDDKVEHHALRPGENYQGEGTPSGQPPGCPSPLLQEPSLDDIVQRTRRGVEKVIDLSGIDIASAQSMAEQLEWCLKTRVYLSELQETIKFTGKQYYNDVQALADERYLDEMLQQIKVVMTEFILKADEVIRHIEGEHLGYVNERASFVSGMLQNYSGKR